MRNMRGGILITLALAVACAGPDVPMAETGGSVAAKPGEDAVVARAGERSFTLDEVDARARATNMQAYQALYDARRAAVDALIEEHLLSAEAAKRGITPEALVAQEVDAKVQQPAQADIETFYNQNKAAMQGRTMEQVAPQIQAYLLEQRKQQGRQALLDAIKKQTPVRVTLDPPRIEVTVAANDPSKGPPGAAVQIVEFSDFQ
jgi:hypothetical protein